MKNNILAALTGCFVYGGILLFPTLAKADTVQDMLNQLDLASKHLKALQNAGWPSMSSLPAEELPPEEPEYDTYTVTMTAYNAVPGQTDDSPEYTSIGAWTNPDIIAARSSDLADELPYGTVISVMPATTTPNCGYKYVSERIGLRVIGDAMNARMRNKIDILMDTEPIRAQEGKMRNPAKAFGFCRNITIAVVGKVDPKHIPKTQTELAAAIGLAQLAINR